MNNFLKIISQPDNIPIVIMLFLLAFFLGLALWQGILNDRSRVKPQGPRKEADKVFTFPYLVRSEFLSALVVTLVLFVWSLWIDAPLEEPANPAKTPNPSKAPWYFLGLQEMLVYFDPWIAGVVLPSLIIVGLMAIPYMDRNPLGNGYYTWKERKWAIMIFCFGFFFLWVAMITVGTFFRGPGWNFFMLGQEWDPHKIVALTNVNLSDLFHIRSQGLAMLFGVGVIGAYYSLAMISFLILKLKKSQFLKDMGIPRFFVFMFFFLTMMALPIKMVLRYTLNVKYILVTPWFNV
ncbi:MAG: cytochrome C [Chlamydiae bacterium]|nr:cytochrome C [Chlamydiota bacterium]MBI3266759.1 cytochrome C [Chlamydiota bacterium]